MHTFWCLKSYAPVFLILVADVAIHFRFIYYESNFSWSFYKDISISANTGH